MNFEKLIYRRVPLWMLLFLLLSGLVALLIFGALVSYGQSGGRRFRALTEPSLALATFPVNLAKALKPVPEPVTHEPREDLPEGFWHDPKFVDEGYALIPHYVASRRRYVVDLLRLRDGAVVHQYAPNIADINSRSRIGSSIDIAATHSPAQYRITHPLLMPDGGIVFHDDTPEVRVDACGAVRWTVDGIFHHSNEFGPDGNIWAPQRVLKSTLPHVSDDFSEGAIAEISPDGRLLKFESIPKILERNNLAHLWRSIPYTSDPLHTNDVQPVMGSGPYWQKGDLFVSMRNISTIMLYRPSTGRVLWWHQGPWSMQHDVDVLDDHRISVFDNGVQSGPDGPLPWATNGDYVLNHNRLLVYDFAMGKVQSPFEAAFAAQQIRTVTQGLATMLDNGDVFVEETNYGRLLRMSRDGTVRWRYISTRKGGERYEMGWSRYIDPKTDAAGIRAAITARCG